MDCGICYDEKKLYYLNHVSQNKCFIKICKECSNSIDKDKCPFCRIKLKNVIIKSKMTYFLFYLKHSFFLILQFLTIYLSLKYQLPYNYYNKNIYITWFILTKFIIELGYLAFTKIDEKALQLITKFDVIYMFHTSIFINGWDYIFLCYISNIFLFVFILVLVYLIKGIIFIIYYPYRQIHIYNVNGYLFYRTFH